MSLYGLPKGLEKLMTTLLDENLLTSWKTFGYLKTTTLVLKFDCELSSEQHVVYRRKPPSTIQRDRIRGGAFQSLSKDINQ
jgi:hypothetical protein